MERLRKLRQDMGVTQEQLADDLSVAKSTIGMWENQKREPDLKMLEKIADFFKTSVDYLIGRVDEQHSFFRAFSTNMLPDEILECCNGDTEKALCRNGYPQQQRYHLRHHRGGLPADSRRGGNAEIRI